MDAFEPLCACGATAEQSTVLKGDTGWALGLGRWLRLADVSSVNRVLDIFIISLYEGQLIACAP